MIKVLVGLLLLFFFGCTSPSEIGADFIRNEIIDINYSDTLTVQLSTVMHDSLITSNASRFLVGYYEDEYFGKVKSSAVFQLLPQSALSLDENSIFDQLVLHLKLDGYSYYDTLNGIKLNVYQLEEAIEPSNDYLYNNSVYKAGKSSIGSVDFIPEPNYIDSLDIPISNDIGSELFRLAHNYDESITKEFTEYFKGLAVVPDDLRQSCFLGLNKDVKLRLYYYDNSNIPVTRKYIDFSLGTVYFNQIQSDRSGTLLDHVKQETELPSMQSEHLSSMQAGVGLGLKVMIPFLKEFGYLSSNRAIVKAELKLTPMNYVNDDNIQPPKSFDIYLIDNENEIQKQFSNTAELKADDLGRNIYYSLDVTSFITSKVKNLYLTDYSLLLLPKQDELNSSVNRVLLGDSQSAFKSTLKIYYTEIN
jgi:hypothetical protein